jgi:uncharacterized protein (TIGR02001 family)
MIRRCISIVCIALAILPGRSALAQRAESSLHAALTLMSDYKHAGLSQSGSEPAAKLSVDYAHRSGFFAGGFLANVEYAAEYGSATPRDLQLDVYAGYEWRGSRWSANAIVSRYLYPDIDIRYDYTQTSLNAGFRDRYFFGASYSRNFFSIDRPAYQYYAGAAVPLPQDMELGINLGRYRSSGLFSYTFWDIGISKTLRRFALDFRYHDNTYDRTTRLGDGHGDRWVFSVSYAIGPLALN